MLKFLDKTGLDTLWAKIKSTFQTLGNLVTAWGSTPSDTKYPSEKLVKTALDVKAPNAPSEVTIATGDKPLIADSSDGNKVKRASTSFDTEVPNTFLKRNGTFGKVLYADEGWGGVFRTSMSPGDTYFLQHRNCFFGVKPSAVAVEYSTDGGTTWQDYGLTAAQKQSLFNQFGGTNVYCGKHTHLLPTYTGSLPGTKDLSNANVANQRLRITICCEALANAGTTSTTDKWLCANIRRIGIYMSTHGASVGPRHCVFTARKKPDFRAGNDTWLNFGDFAISGDSGWNSIPCNNATGEAGIIFGNSYDTQYTEFRFEIWSEGLSSAPASSSTGNMMISKIVAFSELCWANSSSNPNLAYYGMPCTVNAASGNAHFSKGITSGVAIPISSGGTEATTKKGAEFAICGNMPQATAAMADNFQIVFSQVGSAQNATNGVFIYRTALTVWNYFKGKMSSDTGVNISGKAATATDLASGSVLSVSKGGTGKSSVTNNNFLVGNGTGALVEKTPSEVRTLIGAGTSSLTIGTSSTQAAAGDHKHGTMHSSFRCTVPDQSSDTTWETNIGLENNGFWLKSLRMQNNAPNWLVNNFGAGIAFGGADTKGVISLAYDNSAKVQFAGGNGTSPNWYWTLKGSPGKTYTLPSDTCTLQAALPTSGTASTTYAINVGGNAATATTASNFDTSGGTIKSSLSAKVNIASDGVVATSNSHWDIIMQVATIASNGVHYKRWLCNSDGTSAFVDYRPNSYNASFMLEAYAVKWNSYEDCKYKLLYWLAGKQAPYVAELIFNSAQGLFPETITWRDTGVADSATTATNYNTSSGTIKTALEGKANGTRWTAVTKGQTWSRLFYSVPSNSVEGSSGILAVSCTRGVVVCNATFLITASYSGASYSSIIELASCNYTQVRSRIVVNPNGNYYFEVYDTAQSIAPSTTQRWHCTFLPLLGADLTTYTEFTDGTTIPSGYTATNDFTTTGGNAAAAIKNITRSGTTFTATRQDGSTFTFTQQDSNNDTKVVATAKTTDNANYKILATASASPTSGGATEAMYSPNIALNPSTNTISANITGDAQSVRGLYITKTIVNDPNAIIFF